MPRALIIDDEFHARADLRELLAAYPSIEVVGEASTLDTARALLARDDYSLVFLDIQLFGGSGFDLMPDVHPGAAIIFVTAHNQHALRAFEVNALDYLLKPVRRERLAESLRRVAAAPAGEPGPTPPPPAPPMALRIDDSVHLNCGARSRFVRVAEISRIEADENYSRVGLAAGTEYHVRRTLKSWEESLPTDHFIRAHRNSLVNLNQIAGHGRTGLRALTLSVRGIPEPVVVSRQSTAEVRTRLRARFPGV